jgi:hypothetical protein
MISFPLQILSGTYADRIAYSTATLVPGQVWYQTNDSDGTAIGYYYWNGGSWIFDATQASGGIDIDGRGQNLGMGGSVRVNNSANGSTLILSNPDNYDAFLGLWSRTVGGPSIVYGVYISQDGQIAFKNKHGQTMGLWSFNPNTGASERLLDLSYDLNGDGRMRQLLYYGAGVGAAQISGISKIDIASYGNVSTPETDAFTYVLPANSLITQNQGAKIFAAGTTAANANSKRARIVFGGTTIADTTSIAANGVHWEIEARIIMNTPTSQIIVGRANFGTNSARFTNTSAAENLTTPIDIITKLTGGATNDTIQDYYEVEVFG